MACFIYNSLYHEHHFSLILCKCLSSPNFPCFSHTLTFSPPKHTTVSVFKPNNVNDRLRAKLPATTDFETPSKTKTLTSRRECESQSSNLTTPAGRTENHSLEKLGSSVDEKFGDNDVIFAKDKVARKNMNYRRSRELGDANSFSTSKDGNGRIKSVKNMNFQALDDKTKKRTRKVGGAGTANTKKTAKGTSKKSKTASPEFQLRVALDKCSKRGDVIGAIQLYDSAQIEGIRIGQYHYTVLLYLCSSAAVGVVQPAKSGTTCRTSSALDSTNVVANLDVVEPSVLGDMGDRKAGAKELNTQVSTSGQSSASGSSIKLSSGKRFDKLDSSTQSPRALEGLNYSKKGSDINEVKLSEDVKQYALWRGFEIYEKMLADKIPMNEATLTAVARMAMSMGDGDMAFDMVKQMKSLGINPKLRSYDPALIAFCTSGDVDKAFSVEKHMLEHGVHPEEPKLEALLRASVGAGKGDKVYYLLHKLRTTVRKVSPSTAGVIIRWFKSKAASKFGKTRWDQRVIEEAIKSGGGGWHGQGWLGKGRWLISSTSIGQDAICQCCGDKLATIDLDPVETENFAHSVASIAIKRDKDSSFQKFQKWLDYYGPYDAVIDGANVGLFSQKRFIPSKINTIVNGIRHKLPSKRWPLIVLHNKRIRGPKMDEVFNRALIEKWKNADALYATPTGSNDDWYWLYAAIRFKCLIVTNDEMRDHRFQLLGNDFFPRWKERHQVRFSFSDAGPVFHMPPPYSVVIQESEKGHWHIPIATDHEYEAERSWLCIKRAKSGDRTTKQVESRDANSEVKMKPQEAYRNLRHLLSTSVFTEHRTVLSEIEAAEKLGGCIIDFQI